MVVNKKKAEEIRILVQEKSDKKAELGRAQIKLADAINGKYRVERVPDLDHTVVKLRRELQVLEKKLEKKIERSEVSPNLAAIAGSKAELAKTKPSGHLFKSSRKDSHGYE